MNADLLIKVIVGSTPVIAVLVAAAFLTPPDLPLLARQMLLCAFALGGLAVAERMLFGPGARRIASAMGFNRARRPAVMTAILCSLPMWLFLPIHGWTTGRPVVVSTDWLAILSGIVLVNGIAEEVIHRAFVFGHLRQVHSFAVSAAIGAIIFGLQHFYLLVTIGVVAGTASIILAVLLVWPLALLFERGGNSIIPPAILHSSSNAPMMIFVSADIVDTVVLPHMAVVLASMYLSFALVFRQEQS